MSIVDTVKNAFTLGRMGQPVAEVQSLSALLLRDQSDEEAARLKAIAARWDAYYGNAPKPLKVKDGDADDNRRLNFAGRIVDKGVSFLFGQDIDFAVSGGRDSAGNGQEEGDTESPEDAWLEACWGANAGMTLLAELAVNGGVAGDAYLMIVPADESKYGHPYPRLLLLDPATVSATWDPCDYKLVQQWVLRWTALDPVAKKICLYRKLITRAPDFASWLITDQMSRNDGRDWDTLGEAALWPYSWSPLFHCQNLPAPNQFYGVSDLEDDVLEAAGGVNFTASNTGRILRLHAHPKTWGRGINATEISMGIDKAVIFKGESAHLENLEMKTDLGSSLLYYDKMKSALHAVARTPEVTAETVAGLGTLSGVALKLLFSPLLDKTATKQRLYGDMLRDLSQRLLEYAGMPNCKVALTWPDPLPGDPVAERQALTMDEALGVSQHTILEKLGYDAEAEQAQKKKEQKDLGDTLLAGFDKGQSAGGGQPE